MNRYLALCYHYIRPQENSAFPKIIGNKIGAFKKHISMLKANYDVISPDDAYEFSYNNSPSSGRSNRPGILFTFDDGLSGHYQAARILAERKIKAFFFVPTCLLKDKLPANPTIIHYCLAHYGISKFLPAYMNALEANNLPAVRYGINPEVGKKDSWQATSRLKNILKYKLPHRDSRRVLLHIYKNLFLKDFPDALRIMHLTNHQVRDIVSMGHSIGAHTNSHISVGTARLSLAETKNELVEPKKYLEKTFATQVSAFAYPYGSKKDCLPGKELAKRTENAYDLAFSIQNMVNTKKTHPLELGRYSVKSSKDENEIKGILEEIRRKNSP